MATALPTALDTFSAVLPTTRTNATIGGRTQSKFQNDMGDAVEAIQDIIVGPTNWNPKGRPFNAVGNGVADDSAALQLCATTIANAGGGVMRIPAGLYLWDSASPFYVDANTSIICDPNAFFVVNNAGTHAPATSIAWMACGVNQRWSGELKINILEGSGLIGHGAFFLGFLIYLVDFERIWIHDCTVYSATQFTQANLIKATADAGWKTVAGTTHHYFKIVDNHLEVNQDAASGGEGISIGGIDSTHFAEFGLIQGNTVIGTGDDAIAIHSGQNVKILDNEIMVVDGRIFLADTWEAQVSRNFCQHTAAIGGGSFIGCTVNSATNPRRPTDIDISHNQMLIQSGQTNIGYGIRLQGCDLVSLVGNMLRNRNVPPAASVVNGIWHGQIISNAVTYPAGRIVTKNNDLVGARIHIDPSAQRDSYAKIGPDTIDGKGLLDDLIDFNSAGDIAGDEVTAGGVVNPLTVFHYNVSGKAVNNLKLLGKWWLKDIAAGAGTSTLTLVNPDITAVQANTAISIAAVYSRFSAGPDHTATINILKGGVLWKSVSHATADGAEKANYGATNTRLAEETHAIGSSITVTLTVPAGWGANQDIEVEVWVIPVM